MEIVLALLQLFPFLISLPNLVLPINLILCLQFFLGRFAKNCKCKAHFNIQHFNPQHNLLFCPSVSDKNTSMCQIKQYQVTFSSQVQAQSQPLGEIIFAFFSNSPSMGPCKLFMCQSHQGQREYFPEGEPAINIHFPHKSSQLF